MFELNKGKQDDIQFLEMVSAIIEGVVSKNYPKSLYLTKIDNWFDYKWQDFSGKTMGALGVWRRNTTIPPFVANRIKDQRYYEFDEDIRSYRFVGNGSDIHYQGWAENNLKRKAKNIAPGTALFWYSGKTHINKRGSLMGYLPESDNYSTWYISFRFAEKWTISNSSEISKNEINQFLKSRL